MNWSVFKSSVCWPGSAPPQITQPSRPGPAVLLSVASPFCAPREFLRREMLPQCPVNLVDWALRARCQPIAKGAIYASHTRSPSDQSCYARVQLIISLDAACDSPFPLETKKQAANNGLLQRVFIRANSLHESARWPNSRQRLASVHGDSRMN